MGIAIEATMLPLAARNRIPSPVVKSLSRTQNPTPRAGESNVTTSESASPETPGGAGSVGYPQGPVPVESAFGIDATSMVETPSGKFTGDANRISTDAQASPETAPFCGTAAPFG